MYVIYYRYGDCRMIKAKAIFSLYSNVVKVIDDTTAYDAQGNPVIYNEATVQAYIDAHAYIAKRQADTLPICLCFYLIL